ncbi:hypothetical protein BaRGS_00019494 [Batillaria attramentaria]|uniref:Uncharacterized protein n=1 Tax=Batillaria attramentaria TaxID=370345 RepID=A0ABD0KPW6_9CAEN
MDHLYHSDSLPTKLPLRSNHPPMLRCMTAMSYVEEPIAASFDLYDQHDPLISYAPYEPKPLQLAKTYGYGYRKPAKQVDPHWSQWPDSSRQKRPNTTTCLTPRPPDSRLLASDLPKFMQPKILETDSKEEYSQALYPPPISAQINPSSPEPEDMNRGNREVIMNRGLSPRRAPPPTMPGRSMTQYGGSFGGHNRGQNSYIGALDLYASPYNAKGYGVDAWGWGIRYRWEANVPGTKGLESTTPNVTGYFIIHPDWVSERLSLRRSQSLLGF